MPQYNDNRTTKPADNEAAIHAYRMENDPEYSKAVQQGAWLAKQDAPLQDASLDMLGGGLAARSVATELKGVAKAFEPSRTFSKEVADKYSKMYGNSAQYAKDNALYFPPTERHYQQLRRAYTSPEGEAMVDRYFQKVNPGAPTIDEQYQVISSLPPEEGFAGLSKSGMMNRKKDWQEIWTALQGRQKWDINK